MSLALKIAEETAKEAAEAKAVNAAFIQHLEDGNIKLAADATSEYTRVYMKEESFLDKIIPPINIGDADLDRQVDTDKPVVIVDKEPESPGAITMPFGNLPINRYIRGPRYRVVLARLASGRLNKDVDELRSYDMDIRQVLSDSSVKDIAAEKDGKFIALCDQVVGAALTAIEGGAGAKDGSNLANAADIGEGNSQNYLLVDANGITREAIVEATKALPANASRMESETALCNNIFIKEILKWGRDEIGGDIAEELVLNGWAERVFMNIRWVVTIKRDLVANNTVYFFVAPKALGKNLILEDVTMWIKKEAYLVEWFAYCTQGASIGNTNGVAKVTFARTAA